MHFSGPRGWFGGIEVEGEAIVESVEEKVIKMSVSRLGVKVGERWQVAEGLFTAYTTMVHSLDYGNI